MRISIVEDNPLLLESLRLVLGGERDMNIVGVFASAEDALTAMSEGVSGRRHRRAVSFDP